MGIIPPSIHGYCLSWPVLACPDGRVPERCVVSDRNLACRKITTIGLHAETLGSYDYGHWLMGRGCFRLSGDRFGLLVSQIRMVFLSNFFCSTEQSYETMLAHRITLI